MADIAQYYAFANILLMLSGGYMILWMIFHRKLYYAGKDDIAPVLFVIGVMIYWWIAMNNVMNDAIHELREDGIRKQIKND